MRLRELQLIAYGHFSGLTLAFGEPATDMHVVFGPNEAGKSTALRAITALLYGMPARTPDAHTHDNKALRVGGVLEYAAGEHLALVRRKGRKRTILDPNERPLDELLLGRALCGVSQSLFVTMFGLDHVTLREGAEALLRGDGDVGETLFDAGGARGIGGVLDALHAEQEELFKARGQTPKLNEALRQLKEAKQSIFMKEMLPSSWQMQRDATEEAQAEKEREVARRQQLGAERQRLQRALRALPNLAKRRELRRQLAELGPVPELPPDARARRVAAEQQRDRCVERAAELRDELAALASEREALHVDDALADLDESVVREVSDRLGNHRKANLDLPKREEALAGIRRDVERLVRELGRDVAASEVDRLFIDKPTRARLTKLRTAHGGLVAELAAARSALSDAKARRETLGERWLELPAPRDVESLRRILGGASRDVELDERIAALGETRRRLEGRIGELGGELGAMTRTPPGRAWVVAQGRRLRELGARERELDEQAERLAQRFAEVATSLSELTQLGAPAAADLVTARARRDELWAELSLDLGRGGAVNPTPFLDAMSVCDGVADRLWQQADRVAQRARLSAEREALEGERRRVSARVEEVRQAWAAAEREWTSAWEGIATPPASPEAAEAWLDVWEAWTAASDELASVRHEQERASGQRAELARQLGALVASSEAESLRELWARADALVRSEDERRSARRALREKLDELDERIAVLQGRASERETALEQWQRAWGEVMTTLGLATDASLEEAAAVEAVLEDLFRRSGAADELTRRIAGMRRDAGEFEAMLAPLLTRFGAATASEPLERAAEAFIALHRDARAARARRAELDDKLAAKRDQLASLVQETQVAEGALAEIMRAAGVTSSEGLGLVEERVELAARLTAALAETENALFAEGAIAELEELTRELDIDAARERADELEEEYRSVAERCEQLSGAIGAAKRGLSELERKEGAAGAAAEREASLAAAVRLAERYVRVRLAAVVLEREIERYRQKNQGPILARASELFPRLTLGRYTALSVGFDEQDEPALRCTRADGTEVDVAGLSDGTRDQLYLALRLASLERYGERSELLPLVLDDVLIHFDDDRALAALEVLADVATRTQVLFFTHHARLVELARGLSGVTHHSLA